MAPSILPAEPELQIAAEELHLSPAEAAKELKERLPSGWIACCSEGGEVYYHHHSGKVSQWSHPSTQEKSLEVLADELLKGGNPNDLADSLDDPGTAKNAVQRPSSHSVYDARSRHVPLPTPGSLFSDGPGPIQREDLQVGRAFALHGLLTPEEAASYCTSAARAGFAGSDVAREFPSNVRNNARLVHFSDALAAALYRRLLPLLCHRDIFMLQPMGFGAEGRWKPCGVNPCFRISRYQPGDARRGGWSEHFAEHCDGMYTNDDGECSIYSVVLYLNDDYEGGELEFSEGSASFKAAAGSAVLFPHDLPHAGLAVQKGTKYIARSELMFRCVDRERPPQEANFAKDPLFQRMAALYEHIGDLVKLGDVRATTEAYQEALGIQIAHQGTCAVTDARRHAGRSRLEGKTWEAILSFLQPSEVCRAAISVSPEWHEFSRSGLLWQGWFQQRWPQSDEVLQGEAYALDAELKDWMGLYRRDHLLSSSPRVTVIFPGACLACDDGRGLQELVPAVCRNSGTGVGWDRSLKQRQGWTVGKGVIHPRSFKTWHQNGVVDFHVLPELFAWSFQHFKVRPAEQHLVVPMLPGLMTGSAQERLATILHRRFQVQRLSFVSAPLCALAARDLKSGTVIWGCAFGLCSVFCFYEEELVGSYGSWDFDKGTVQEVAEHVANAMKQLNDSIRSAVSSHVVISCEPCIALKNDPRPYGASTIEVDGDLRKWAEEKELREQLKLHDLSPKLHGRDARHGAVCRGARRLASRAPLVVPHRSPESWEWRAFAQGQWHRLPPYMSSVFEGALRHDKDLASVQLVGRLGFYLVANLKDFTVAVAEPLMFRGQGIQSISEMHRLGPWCPLTRFLRGRPSTEPDRRKPEDLEQECEETEQVQEVAEEDALHVRTLAGKLVFSQAKTSALHFQDMLLECAKQMKTSSRRLQFLNGTTRIQCHADLQKALEEVAGLDLSVLLGPEPPAESREPRDLAEQIPEDLPGEMSRRCNLQSALLSALRKRQ